jgi:hypothetical protein
MASPYVRLRIVSQLLGPLRAQVRPGLPLFHQASVVAFTTCRSFSACTRPALARTTLLSRSVGLQNAPRQPTLPSPRFLSLGSIFGRSAVAPTPSPAAIAGISRLESEANANPQDLGKQLALFEGLAGTKTKAGYDVIVSRWERMCEFVRFVNCFARAWPDTVHRTPPLHSSDPTLHSDSI